MSFHFVSHPWEMQEVDNGILVTLAHRDLDVVDELYDLVLENGQRNLYLDFARMHFMASVLAGKLLALDARLQKVGGRVVLCNVHETLHEILRKTRVTDVLDVRVEEYQRI